MTLATWLPFATANCGVEFLYPQPGLTFYYLDTVNVTYTSNFSNPTLFAWCGQASPAQKFEATAPKHNGSVLVLLDFSSSDPCWFDLRPNTPACGDNSPKFTLLPVQRSQSGSHTTVGLDSPTSTASPVPSKTGAEAATGGELSPGAKAGIVVAAVGASLVVVGMAAWFFFSRRKRLQEAVLAGHIIAHDTRGKKGGGQGHEKAPLRGSAHSNSSAEPLQVQPVYDGFPGSSGYDDVRSSPVSSSNAYLHSPQSPSSSSGGGGNGFFPPARNNSSERGHFLSEREELDAARMHSAPLPSGVVSYGPNPVTPSITPRPSTRFRDTNTPGSPVSGDRHDEHYAPSTHSSVSPQPQTQYPAKPPPPPLVVSYGPNRITPTPVIATAAVTPDESVLKRPPPDLPEFPVMAFPSHPFPSHEPQPPHGTTTTTTTTRAPADAADSLAQRYNLSDDPASPLPPADPLPPYASSADFESMAAGAIRKMREPEPHAAELPPTKDGYYYQHYPGAGAEEEYELQGSGGSAQRSEPLRPHRPYANRLTAAPGPGPGQRGREVDEQKFLLSDVEMAQLKRLKERVRAGQPAGEAYEMQRPRGASGSRSRSRSREGEKTWTAGGSRQ